MVLKIFDTEDDYPGVTMIKAGAWVFDIWAAVTEHNDCTMKVYAYKRVLAGTLTELFNFTIAIPEVGISQHFYSVTQNAISMLATDRLEFKFCFINPTLTVTTMHLGVEGVWPSNIRIPLAAVIPDAGLQIGDWDDFLGFDYPDIESGVSQTYYLTIKARFAFRILSAVLQSDNTMDDVTIEIDGNPLVWTGSAVSIDVTASIVETEAIDDNEVSAGQVVTLVTSGTDAGATLIRGQLNYVRI
jgi:hypothetical protein